MQKTLRSLEETLAFGAQLGEVLRGGEVLELIGDVGAGKTSLTKGIARGLGIREPIQSPTFTISRQYGARDGLRLTHYDFYRLPDAGLMREELAESVGDKQTVVILEWAAIVEGVLPDDRLVLTFSTLSEDSREITITAGGPVSRQMVEQLA